LTIRTVARIDVPGTVVNDLALGDTASFLQTAGNLTIPEPATTNGFYVNRIRTAYGVAVLPPTAVLVSAWLRTCHTHPRQCP